MKKLSISILILFFSTCSFANSPTQNDEPLKLAKNYYQKEMLSSIYNKHSEKAITLEAQTNLKNTKEELDRETFYVTELEREKTFLDMTFPTAPLGALLDQKTLNMDLQRISLSENTEIISLQEENDHNSILAAKYMNFAGILMDFVTTEISLKKGNIEANPLLGKNPSTAVLLSVMAVRAGYIELITYSNFTDEQKLGLLRIANLVNWFPAGNNLAVIQKSRNIGTNILSGIGVGFGATLLSYQF